MLRKIILATVAVFVLSYSITKYLPHSSDIYILPNPLKTVEIGEKKDLAMLRGLSIDRNNPEQINFIVDSGSNNSVDKKTTQRLLRYFVSGLSLLEDDLWVNLNPAQPHRIITDEFAKTEAGAVMLAQDYMLKLVTASLTDFQTKKGMKFWANFEKTSNQKKYDMSMVGDLMHRIWISPGPVVIHRSDDTIEIVDAPLDVTLEKMNKTKGNGNEALEKYILDKVRHEVMYGENFAPLRQLHMSVALAVWFKRNVSSNVYNSFYDTNNTSLIDTAPNNFKGDVYNSYMRSYEKGVYDVIKAPSQKQNSFYRYTCGGISGLESVRFYSNNDKPLRYIGSKYIIDAERVLGFKTSSSSVSFSRKLRLLTLTVLSAASFFLTSGQIPEEPGTDLSLFKSETVFLDSAMYSDTSKHASYINYTYENMLKERSPRLFSYMNIWQEYGLDIERLGDILSEQPWLFLVYHENILKSSQYSYLFRRAWESSFGYEQLLNEMIDKADLAKLNNDLHKKLKSYGEEYKQNKGWDPYQREDKHSSWGVKRFKEDALEHLGKLYNDEGFNSTWAANWLRNNADKVGQVISLEEEVSKVSKRDSDVGFILLSIMGDDELNKVSDDKIIEFYNVVGEMEYKLKLLNYLIKRGIEPDLIDSKKLNKSIKNGLFPDNSYSFNSEESRKKRMDNFILLVDSKQAFQGRFEKLWEKTVKRYISYNSDMGLYYWDKIKRGFSADKAQSLYNDMLKDFLRWPGYMINLDLYLMHSKALMRYDLEKFEKRLVEMFDSEIAKFEPLTSVPTLDQVMLFEALRHSDSLPSTSALNTSIANAKDCLFNAALDKQETNIAQVVSLALLLRDHDISKVKAPLQDNLNQIKDDTTGQILELPIWIVKEHGLEDDYLKAVNSFPEKVLTNVGLARLGVYTEKVLTSLAQIDNIDRVVDSNLKGERRNWSNRFGSDEKLHQEDMEVMLFVDELNDKYTWQIIRFLIDNVSKEGAEILVNKIKKSMYSYEAYLYMATQRPETFLEQAKHIKEIYTNVLVDKALELLHSKNPELAMKYAADYKRMSFGKGNVVDEFVKNNPVAVLETAALKDRTSPINSVELKKAVMSLTQQNNFLGLLENIDVFSDEDYAEEVLLRVDKMNLSEREYALDYSRRWLDKPYARQFLFDLMTVGEKNSNVVPKKFPNQVFLRIADKPWALELMSNVAEIYPERFLKGIVGYDIWSSYGRNNSNSYYKKIYDKEPDVANVIVGIGNANPSLVLTYLEYLTNNGELDEALVRWIDKEPALGIKKFHCYHDQKFAMASLESAALKAPEIFLDESVSILNRQPVEEIFSKVMTLLLNDKPEIIIEKYSKYKKFPGADAFLEQAVITLMKTDPATAFTHIDTYVDKSWANLIIKEYASKAGEVVLEYGKAMMNKPYADSLFTELAKQYPLSAIKSNYKYHVDSKSRYEYNGSWNRPPAELTGTRKVIVDAAVSTKQNFDNKFIEEHFEILVQYSEYDSLVKENVLRSISDYDIDKKMRLIADKPYAKDVFFKYAEEQSNSLKYLSLVKDKDFEAGFVRQAIEHNPSQFWKNVRYISSRSYYSSLAATMVELYPVQMFENIEQVVKLPEAAKIIVQAAQKTPLEAARTYQAYKDQPYGRRVMNYLISKHPGDVLHSLNSWSFGARKKISLDDLTNADYKKLILADPVAALEVKWEKIDYKTRFNDEDLEMFFIVYSSGKSTEIKKRQLLLMRLTNDFSMKNFDMVNEASSDPQKFFKKMLEFYVETKSLADAKLTVEFINDHALAAVQEMNYRHDDGDAYRFETLDGRSAMELYFILCAGAIDAYPSTISGVVSRLKRTILSEGNFSEFFDAINYKNFRLFMKIIAENDYLEDFQADMSNTFFKDLCGRFVSGLDRVNDPLSEAVVVADMFSVVRSDEALRTLQTVIKSEYERVSGEGNANVTVIYGLLSGMFSQNALINKEWFETIAQKYQLDDPVRISNKSLLDPKHGNIQQYVFYGDEDGSASFNNWINYYKSDPNWKLHKYESYVKIKSLKGNNITIYANRPYEHYLGLNMIADELAKDSLVPHVVVHRGHVYHMASTFDARLINSKTSFVFLGACGGYSYIDGVLSRAPRAHVISTKSVGTMHINDPLLKIINERIRLGKAIDWSEIWGAAKKKGLEKNPAFDSYVPSHQNLGLIFIKAYRKILSNSSSALIVGKKSANKDIGGISMDKILFSNNSKIIVEDIKLVQPIDSLIYIIRHIDKKTKSVNP